MVRAFITAFVALALSGGGSGFGFAERGSRASKTSETAATDGSVLESPAQPEAARADETAPAAPAKSTRSRSSRKERAAAAARASDEQAASSQEPPAQAVAVPSTVAQSAQPSDSVPPPQPQAIPSETSAQAAPPVAPEMAPDFPAMRALGGIGIVLTLMIGGFFATRKFAPQLFQKPVAQKSLKILETLQMGDKRSIAIVQVGERRLLLGNTSSRITLLAPLENAPESESDGVPAGLSPKHAQAAAGSFRNIFDLEKRTPATRNGGAAKTIAPDVRAKMRQLREALEE